jgi:hypothetical protein
MGAPAGTDPNIWDNWKPTNEPGVRNLAGTVPFERGAQVPKIAPDNSPGEESSWTLPSPHRPPIRPPRQTP